MNSHDRSAEFRMARWCVHLAAATALLVAAVLYCALVAGPMAASRHRQLDDIQRLEAIQQAASGAERAEAELRRTLAAVKRRETELLERIPQRAAEHEFLQAITHTANEAGVQLVDYGRESAVEEPTHSALRIGIRCRGGYAGICQLLQGLRRLERLVIIERFNVTSDLTSDELAMELTVVLYYGLNTPAPEEIADV